MSSSLDGSGSEPDNVSTVVNGSHARGQKRIRQPSSPIPLTRAPRNWSHDSLDILNQRSASWTDLVSDHLPGETVDFDEIAPPCSPLSLNGTIHNPGRGSPAQLQAAVPTKPPASEVKMFAPIVPKHPLSAYVHFYKELRDRNSAAVKKRKARFLNADALSAAVDQQWKELSDQEREKYEEIAREDTLRYEREMAAKDQEESSKKQSNNSPDITTPTLKSPSKVSVTESEQISPSASRHVERTPIHHSASAPGLPREFLSAHLSPPTYPQPRPHIPTRYQRSFHPYNTEPRPLYRQTASEHLPPEALPNGMVLELPDRATGYPRRYQVQYVSVPMTLDHARQFLSDMRKGHHSQR